MTVPTPTPAETEVLHGVLEHFTAHRGDYLFVALCFLIGVACYTLMRLAGWGKGDGADQHTARQEVWHRLQDIAIAIGLMGLWTTGLIWVVLDYAGYDAIDPVSISAGSSVLAGFLMPWVAPKLISYFSATVVKLTGKK